MADLRLDRLEEAVHEGPSGYTAIVPGNADESELIRRICSNEDYDRMPPPETGKQLTDEQVALVRRWIDEGADWEEHWAFVAPKKPEPPAIRDPHWPKNEVDHFVQAQLEKRGWQPRPEADRETLIRRVTFDLTGLPPTLAEVDAFLADRSTDAFEEVVDRLLASPHYGEHMARYWLDAARYGDTHGLHLDNYREMWPYRDWVVKAFNDNKAFNEFTVEQLAGDLLPAPSLEQLVATGFGRAHVTTNEGGSIEEEVYVRNVIDRVSTTGTVFLGLTLGCAACHDHKFDPVSQEEFYQLFAFFNSLDGPALDGNVKDPAPIVQVPSDDQLNAAEKLRSEMEEARKVRDARTQATLEGFDEWLEERRLQRDAATEDQALQLRDGLVVHCTFDDQADGTVSNGADPDSPVSLRGDASLGEGRLGNGLNANAEGFVDLGDTASFQDDRAFSFGAWIKTANGLNGTILSKTDAEQLHKGYELTVLDGVVNAQIARKEPGYFIRVMTAKPVIKPGEWRHVFVTYDGSQRAAGFSVYVDGEPQEVDVWSDSMKYKNGILHKKPLLIGRRDSGTGFVDGSIDEARIYDRRLTDAEVRAVYLETVLSDPTEDSGASWVDNNAEALRHFYLVHRDGPFREASEQLTRLRQEYNAVQQSVPTTLIFRERKTPREAFVLERGEYDQHGAPVERSTPAALPPLPDDAPRDRLGLAHWLVSPQHPLTARVAVNRFWQQVFGTGIVETAEDFGNQGATPSHPLLLDWLAVEFQQSGWDVKALMRLIVTSAAYRQDATIQPELVDQDPQNRFLARGPRFRLEAEMLRDQALAVSGLLETKLGGPSVKPPQPAGLWKAVGFSSSNTVEFIPGVAADEIYRRSLYTFYKRTAPPPQMTTFDAPSRESSCVRRERTNTPLQALALLNGPQYVEAARALARRVAAAGLDSDGQRAAYMYRLCTARSADPETAAELQGLYNDQLSHYRSNPDDAQALVDAAEQGAETNRLAAWTVVANVVLNLDEVVTKN